MENSETYFTCENRLWLFMYLYPKHYDIFYIDLLTAEAELSRLSWVAWNTNFDISKYRIGPFIQQRKTELK